jgi:hypothetical protein
MTTTLAAAALVLSLIALWEAHRSADRAADAAAQSEYFAECARRSALRGEDALIEAGAENSAESPTY